MSKTLSGWHGTETAHFAIYSTQDSDLNSERQVLTRLESARLFFEKTGLLTSAAAPQLNILTLGSQSDADIYRVNPAAYAFYQRTREGDFVVTRDLAPQHQTVTVHEYTHFVMEHAGFKLPLWLNEGVADFYSTVESRKSQIVLGIAPSGRDEALASSRWIDWATLVAVDHDSPYYRQADKMFLFYAQSWAMVHMLALDPQYAAGFRPFLHAVSDGATTSDAMLAVYHKSLDEVGHDLQTYSSRRFSTRVMDLDIRQTSVEIQEVSDASKHADLALAEILASNPQLTQEASLRLASLVDKYPDDPRPEESLGFQAMQAGRNEEAQQHFALAVKLNSQNPDVWFRLAHLKLQAQGPTDEVVSLLQRVIAADNNNYGARLELGFAAAKTQQWELAVKSLEGISQLKPEHAYTVSYTLAYCLVEIEQGNKARMYADLARKAAANNADRNEVAGLIRYIDQETPMVVASR